MKHTKKYQRGMTGIGVMLLLGVIACFVGFALKLFPLYNEYLLVKSSMEAVIAQPADKRKTVKGVHKIFLRNTEINGLNRFTDDFVKQAVTIHKDKKSKKKFLRVQYEADNKLFKNVHLLMKVDELLPLDGSGTK